MLKTILVIIIFTSAMTIVANLIPQQITGNINSAFVWALNQINNLAVLSPAITTAIFNSIYIMANFALALCYFFAVKWILNLVS